MPIMRRPAEWGPPAKISGRRAISSLRVRHLMSGGKMCPGRWESTLGVVLATKVWNRYGKRCDSLDHLNYD